MPRQGSHARPHYGFVILALVILAVFGSLGLGRFGYTSLLPSMQEHLQLTNVQTGQLQSWNLAGYLSTVVFAGLLATRFGPRVVIGIALGVTSLALLMTGLGTSFEAACWGRFLAGVGGAGANVPAIALLSSWFAPRRRGMASGAGVAGSSIGLMVTGPLIPWILSRHGVEGWRVGWYTLAAMAGIVALLCAVFLRNRPEEMGLRVLGETASDPNSSRSHQSAAAFNWSLVYRSKRLWHLAAVYFAFGFSYIIYTTFFIRYLVKEGDFTQNMAGLLWFKIGIVSALSGFVWGAISDRWGRRRALLGVFLIQGVSFLILGLSVRASLVYLSAGLFAITAWSIPALMAALAGDIFGARLAPAALGLMTIVFGAGQALGPYFAGRIADATHSFSLAFLAAGTTAILLGAGGATILQDPRTETQRAVTSS